jgi:hypothetical protein
MKYHLQSGHPLGLCLAVIQRFMKFTCTIRIIIPMAGNCTHAHVYVNNFLPFHPSFVSSASIIVSAHAKKRWKIRSRGHIIHRAGSKHITILEGLSPELIHFVFTGRFTRLPITKHCLEAFWFFYLPMDVPHFSDLHLSFFIEI